MEWSLKSTVDIGCSVVLTVAACILVWLQVGAEQRPIGNPVASEASDLLPSQPLGIEGSAVQGSPSAPIVIIEFGDFECQYCGSFARSRLLTLRRTHIETGRVQFAFRHLPLERRHPTARLAAEYAECARRQGRFWEFHDAVFASQSSVKLSPATLEAIGTSDGLNEVRLGECRSGPSPVTAQVERDLALSAEIGIRRTPTFLIGKLIGDGQVRVLRVVGGLNGFDAALEAVLAETADNRNPIEKP